MYITGEIKVRGRIPVAKVSYYSHHSTWLEKKLYVDDPDRSEHFAIRAESMWISCDQLLRMAKDRLMVYGPRPQWLDWYQQWKDEIPH